MIQLTQDSLGVDTILTIGEASFNVLNLGKLPFEVVSQSETVQLPFLPFSGNHSSDFIFWIFLGVVVVWAWLKYTNEKRMTQLIESFFSNRFVDQWIREEGLLRSDVNVWLLLTAFSVIGVALWQLPWFGGVLGLEEETPFIRFLWLFMGFVVFYLIRILVVLTSNFLITKEDFSSIYIFNSFQFTQVLAAVLFPISLLYAFGFVFNSTVFITLISGLFVVTFVSRLLKLGYLGITQSNFSLVYIILYLCSLEILPVGLVFAWISNS